MNEPLLEESVAPVAACCAEVDERVRRNPGMAIFVAVGTGLAIGLLVRALRPEPTPQRRLTRLLEDLESRVRDAAEPAVRKAGSFARDGASALHEGLQLGETGIDHLLRSARKQVRRFLA